MNDLVAPIDIKENDLIEVHIQGCFQYISKIYRDDDVVYDILRDGLNYDTTISSGRMTDVSDEGEEGS